MLDDPEPDPWAKWRHMLDSGSGIDLAELQRTHEVRVLPAARPGSVLRAPGVHRRRAGRLLPALVRRGHRAVRGAVRRRVGRGGLAAVSA